MENASIIWDPVEYSCRWSLAGRVPDAIRRVDVSPPGGLSDHSMIVGHVDVVLPGPYDTVTRRARSWCSFDVDAFLRDVTDSLFVRSPPTDVNELFTEYFSSQHIIVATRPTRSGTSSTDVLVPLRAMARSRLPRRETEDMSS